MKRPAVEAMRAGAHDYISKQNLVRLVPAIEREIGEVEARNNKRKTERALRQSEERFHKLVEAMPIGLLLSDSAQRIVYGNSALLKLLGYRRGDIDGGALTFDQIVVPDPLVEAESLQRHPRARGTFPAHQGRSHCSGPRRHRRAQS